MYEPVRIKQNASKKKIVFFFSFNSHTGDFLDFRIKKRFDGISILSSNKYDEQKKIAQFFCG